MINYFQKTTTEGIPTDHHQILHILTEEAHENAPHFEIINMETNKDLGATIEPVSVQTTNLEAVTITTESMTTENFTFTTAETTTTTTTTTTTSTTTSTTTTTTTTTEATTTPQPFCETEYCRYISSLAKEPQKENRECLDLSKVKCTTFDKKLKQVIKNTLKK